MSKQHPPYNFSECKWVVDDRLHNTFEVVKYIYEQLTSASHLPLVQPAE
jgi:hypothetical protein